MAAVVYGVLLLLMRLSGKRTVGQFTPFDILVVMLLSESVSSGLNGTEDSVTGGLLAAATLIALNVLVAAVTARSARLQALGEGDPVLIGRDGRLFATALRRNHVPLPDVERALREADCDLADMKFAFLEADGGISVLKDSSGKVRQEERTSGRGCTSEKPKGAAADRLHQPPGFSAGGCACAFCPGGEPSGPRRARERYSGDRSERQLRALAFGCSSDGQTTGPRAGRQLMKCDIRPWGSLRWHDNR
ncbi:uncharacterized membrane protein YcaP (DUF421 family) [Hydrogenophaga laconesensis]|uniref:Uncharacterized membrane protein YcaP (DUF421 family) n=1 Tax=Hydrogenophaga laconesensis TaxID=1805971 RepID=A0ABU1VDW9_9BURK|nr:YetF domain-containing protein [Hydrogenophaga laconesensis]MDR7095659.1 uncharacterized membrane protein YcaP (DUF421 family) [Hydrogenophaga laconesensis]